MWRQKAAETFPELSTLVENAETPYLLWIDLVLAFEDAYDKTPRDESLIRRVYRFSKWCCEQERGKSAEDDLLTCVGVCFYEHIALNTNAREDMPRWWQAAGLIDESSGEPTLLTYHLDARQREELRAFLEREKHRYDPTLWDDGTE